jgi:hypothetical protein
VNGVVQRRDMHSSRDVTRGMPGRRLVSLGQVKAPKPLNLPSQKQENHGLDPSVNIVPKVRSGASEAFRQPAQPTNNAPLADNHMFLRENLLQPQERTRGTTSVVVHPPAPELPA